MKSSKKSQRNSKNGHKKTDNLKSPESRSSKRSSRDKTPEMSFPKQLKEQKADVTPRKIPHIKNQKATNQTMSSMNSSSQRVVQDDYASIIQDDNGYDVEVASSDEDEESKVNETPQEEISDESSEDSGNRYKRRSDLSSQAGIQTSTIKKSKRGTEIESRNETESSDEDDEEDDSSEEESSSEEDQDEQQSVTESEEQSHTQITRQQKAKPIVEEKKQKEESISEDEESSYESSGSSLGTMDQEYEDFIEKYGHLDFRLLNFLPLIKTKQQLMDDRQAGIDRRLREREQDMQRVQGGHRRFQSNLTKIEEEDDESYSASVGAFKNRDSQDKKSKKQRASEKVEAERFDFRLNNKYYIINIKIDEAGERIQSLSNLQGRVVSRSPLQYIDPELTPKQQKSRQTVGIQFQRSKYYFQYRLDSCNRPNPKICIGICRADFLVNQDLSRQKNVWCMNLGTGDIYHDKKWREYYDNERESKKRGSPKFVAGSIVGVLVDMDRGIMNFYKDGKDLKQAFCMPDLKEGPLFPFVQIQDVCSLSVFHPSVYPKYVEPTALDKGSKKKALVEPEPQPRRSTQKKQSLKQQAKKSARESYKHQRKSMTKKQAKILQKKGKVPKDESAHSSMVSNSKVINPNSSITSSQYTHPNHHRQSSSLDGKNLMWNQLSNFDEKGHGAVGMGTLGGMSHIEPRKEQYDSFLERIQIEKKQLQQKDSVLQQIRDSHRQKELNSQKDQQFYSLAAVSEDVDVNIGELGLNMHNLIQQKDEDIQRIEQLQGRVDQISSRITVGDVNSFQNSFASKRHGAGGVDLTTESQKQLQNLQYEIERNMQEIENLKAKLQVKNQVIGGFNSGNQDAFPPMRNTAYQGGECGGMNMMFCGMGQTNPQTQPRPSSLLNNNRGTIYNFLNRETVKRQLNETEDDQNNEILPSWLKSSNNQTPQQPKYDSRPTYGYNNSSLQNECTIF